MRKYKTLILNRGQVERIVDMRAAIFTVERAFYEYGIGKARLPAKIYLSLPEFNGDFRAMPAYIEKDKLCALKWVNVHPNNGALGLPAVMALIILSDPKTGLPLSVMDGTYITSLRTGAAGAVAAKYLARKDSKIAALVGCGAQARAQLAALACVSRLKEARVWGTKSAYIKRFVRDMDYLGLKFIPTPNLKDCVMGSDIVVTTTPSREPLIRLEWLKPGAHINAIGADAPGKEELDPAILKNAKIIIDNWEQASHSGEINVPLAKGVISKKDIYANIGEVVCGNKKGRNSLSEITVFDSTGLAIQDAALAGFIYKKALKNRVGRWVNFF